MRRPRQRWWWKVLRTFCYTYARTEDHVTYIGENGWWWDRGGRWGPRRTIFWGLISKYFRTWPSGTRGTTPTTTWSWCVCRAPLQENTKTTSGAGRASLSVQPDVRWGRGGTRYSLSCSEPCQYRKNGRRATTRGFEAMWIIVDERVSTRQEPKRDQERIRRMRWAIRATLKTDMRRREETAGEYVEQLLTGDPPLPLESWRRMRGWYRAAVDHTPPPAQVTIKLCDNHILEWLW